MWDGTASCSTVYRADLSDLRLAGPVLDDQIGQSVKCAVIAEEDFADWGVELPQEKASYWPRRIDESEMKDYLNPDAPPLSYSDPASTRSNFYHYMVSQVIVAYLGSA